MPGYAVRIAAAGPVEGPLWRALAQAGAPRSVAELHLAIAAHPNAIQHRLSRWVSAGFVTRHEGRPKRYAMNDTTDRTATPPRVDIAGRAAPRERTAREKLWSAMRVLPSFDVPTLVMTSGATRRSAEELVNVLHRAGYLRQIARGNSRTGVWSTYRLIRNTGPKAPKVSHHVALDVHRRRELVDGNNGARTDISPASISLRSKAAPAAADGGVG